MLPEITEKPSTKHFSQSNTIFDVAVLAGVSKSTAARAFSDFDKICPKTRSRVIKAAQKLNYAPNPLARGLRGGRTNTIGIIWSQTADPASSALLHKISLEMSKRGYLTHISDSLDEESVLKNLLEYGTRRTDGIIYQVSQNESLANKKLLFEKFKAVVLVAQEVVKTGFDLLVLDRCEAYRCAARHFAKSGRKNIGFAGHHESNILKFNAFREELLNWGVVMAKDNSLVFDYTNCKLTQFVEILNSRFSDKFPFDAVMCINDSIAQTLMYWFDSKGYKVPEDVAVIGFNDTEMCGLINPPLASIDRKTEHQVELINKMMMMRLSNPEMPPQIENISMEFVWRKSAG